MENRFVVTGGQPLCGTVRVPAAKNSVLPLLAAAALCEGTVRLRAVPRLSDVECCLALLKNAGCDGGRQGEDLVLRGPASTCALGPQAAEMRASILFCAPLLARCGRAETFWPGGCRIGARPIDLHLAGLAKMGAQVQPSSPGRLVLAAPGGLHGADITLRFPSVGATETLLLAAACAKGETILRGAAREPEVADLANFINRCGGCVRGAGGMVVRIEGRRALLGCEYTPLPDRIYASTLACAAAAAGGRVQLDGCPPALYAPVLELLAQMGCEVETTRRGAAVARYGRLRGIGRVFTGVYPRLATDAAPLLAAAMLCAQDESGIEDVIFERRFACAQGFAEMGARVAVEGRVLRVLPGGALHGAHVCAPDLRGGAALVVAALAARGESQIDGGEYIERGYASLAADLAALGAKTAHKKAK